MTFKRIEGRDVGENCKKVADIVENVIQKTEFEGKVMVVDLKRLSSKEKEQLTWLAMANELCGQKCIRCDYEWCPNVELGLDDKGEPAWRQRYKDNPAYQTKDGFVCERCKNVQK